MNTFDRVAWRWNTAQRGVVCDLSFVEDSLQGVSWDSPFDENGIDTIGVSISENELLNLTPAIHLAEWINRLPNCSDATPVIIKIGRSDYVGAKYTCTHDKGLDRIQTRYYVLGDLPASKKRGNIAYRCESSHGDYDLFVAGWASLETVKNAQYAQFHPFGVWFSLHIWNHAELGNRVDYGERSIYPRMNIKIESI